MNNYILCINAGSSSIKITAVPVDPMASGIFTYQADAVTDYAASFLQLLSSLQREHPEPYANIAATGHRIVHGGPQATPARVIDDVLMSDIESYAVFAPQHTPAALQIIELARDTFPTLLHAACFDTAFFHTLPQRAQRIALPRPFEALGVRRYGFHGLSYEYLLKKLVGKYPSSITEKLVFAHLGSGASVAAIHSTKPIETTMGFTPSSGLVMSTRLGETDPALPVYLNKQAGTSIEDWAHIINKESGLLGVSGISGDMHELLQAESTEPSAKEAIELFVYRVQKAIGEMSAAMGGVDRIIFSGGIGEKSADLRARVLEPFSYLGFSMERERNTAVVASATATGVHDIYAKDSKPIHVIHTDENESIATHVRQLINHPGARK